MQKHSDVQEWHKPRGVIPYFFAYDLQRSREDTELKLRCKLYANLGVQGGFTSMLHSYAEKVALSSLRQSAGIFFFSNFFREV